MRPRAGMINLNGLEVCQYQNIYISSLNRQFILKSTEPTVLIQFIDNHEEKIITLNQLNQCSILNNSKS